MSGFHRPIYLDYHATTPVDPKVLEAMIPYYTDHFGNPASRSHPYGWQASEAVEIARQQVADLIRVSADEIYFTSGATEGLNLAIKGLAESLSAKGKHIITIATEHQAVLDPLEWLASKGFEITILPVHADGLADMDELRTAVRKDTLLVVAMWANNETGVIHDIHTIGRICNESGVALVCDATQATGKIEVHPKETGADIIVMSAHKMYGPKGAGAVYISKNSKKLKPQPLIHGGGHESGYRAGTLNVPGIVGLGKACELRMKLIAVDFNRLKLLRDSFENKILSKLGSVSVNGSVENRLPTVTNLKVDYVDSQAVMTRIRSKLAISSGSACSSANPAPSHVLLAMGLTPAKAKSSFRISFGSPTTAVDAAIACDLLLEAIDSYRSENPVWQMFKQGIDISGLT